MCECATLLLFMDNYEKFIQAVIIFIVWIYDESLNK